MKDFITTKRRRVSTTISETPITANSTRKTRIIGTRALAVNELSRL
jgi:hypothetical protein